MFHFTQNLSYLSITNNYIKNLSNYNNSRLKYLDCSNNKDFVLDITLPHCKQLYINNVGLKSINFNRLPELSILDCGFNNLTQLPENGKLTELNVESNELTRLGNYPALTHLIADNNRLISIKTYPLLESMTIAHNNLDNIPDLSLIKKLIAPFNNIAHIGNMPNLELLDVSHNNLERFVLPKTVGFVSIQINPVKSIKFDPNHIKNLREMEIGYKTYNVLFSVLQVFL